MPILLFCILCLAIATVVSLFFQSVLRGQLRLEAPGLEHTLFDPPRDSRLPFPTIKTSALLSEEAFARLSPNIHQSIRVIRICVLLQLLCFVGASFSMLLL